MMTPNMPKLQSVQTGALAGEDTGVYVGIQQMEYGGQAARHQPVMSAYTATGQPFSVAAGRVSFSFGFKGPAVSCLCEDRNPVARMQTLKPKYGSEPASVGPGHADRPQQHVCQGVEFGNWWLPAVEFAKQHRAHPRP